MNFCLSDLVPPLRWSDASTITLLTGQPDLPDAWWRSLPMPRVLAAIGPESLGELLTEIALDHWPAAAIGDVLPALHVLDPDEADEPAVAIALDRAGSWAGLLALTGRELVDQPFIQARPVLNTLFSAVLVRLAQPLHTLRPVEGPLAVAPPAQEASVREAAPAAGAPEAAVREAEPAVEAPAREEAAEKASFEPVEAQHAAEGAEERYEAGEAGRHDADVAAAHHAAGAAEAAVAEPADEPAAAEPADEAAAQHAHESVQHAHEAPQVAGEAARDDLESEFHESAAPASDEAVPPQDAALPDEDAQPEEAGAPDEAAASHEAALPHEAAASFEGDQEGPEEAVDADAVADEAPEQEAVPEPHTLDEADDGAEEAVLSEEAREDTAPEEELDAEQDHPSQESEPVEAEPIEAEQEPVEETPAEQEPAAASAGGAGHAQELPELIEAAFAGLDDKSWAVAQNRVFTDEPSAVDQLAKLFAVPPAEISATEDELRARLDEWLSSDEAAPYRAHLDTLVRTFGPAAPKEQLIGAADWHNVEIRALEVPAWQFVLATLAPPPQQQEPQLQQAPVQQPQAEVMQSAFGPVQMPPSPPPGPPQFQAFTPVAPPANDANGAAEEQDKPYQPLKDVSQTRRCFRQPDGRWWLRVDVTAEQLGGGECALPTGFATYLGLSPGESRTVRSAAGELNLTWHGRPILESIEHLLVDVGAREGGHLFLTLSDEGVLRARHLPVAAQNAEKITKALRLVGYTAPGGTRDQAARVIATRIGLTGSVPLEDLLNRLRERGDRDLLELLG